MKYITSKLTVWRAFFTSAYNPRYYSVMLMGLVIAGTCSNRDAAKNSWDWMNNSDLNTKAPRRH